MFALIHNKPQNKVLNYIIYWPPDGVTASTLFLSGNNKVDLANLIGPQWKTQHLLQIVHDAPDDDAIVA